LIGIGYFSFSTSEGSNFDGTAGTQEPLNQRQPTIMRKSQLQRRVIKLASIYNLFVCAE
jgi:hypothetical protein